MHLREGDQRGRPTADAVEQRHHLRHLGHLHAPGTDQATGGYRDAIRQWRDIGAAFDLALCELDFVKFVGGENPEAKAAAEEAKSIFQRLGAPAFLQRLNDAVGLPVA